MSDRVTPRGRGRPKNPNGLSPPKPRRNVSMDPEVQELLVEVQTELSGVFGFEPTLSQAIRYCVKRTREALSAERKNEGSSE